MIGLSGWHGVMLLFWAMLFLPPLWVILTKSGHHGAWAFLSLVPVVNIIALWIFAFRTWPASRRG
ncbi:hypothetical protein BH09PSE6_BH09PSE6_18300 [soil metagenome]